MIDKRIKYRYGGDTMGGPNDKSGNKGGNKGNQNTNRERGIMSRGLGPKGTTGNIGGFKDTGPDRSKVSQFSKYGKNVMAQRLGKNLKFDPKTKTMKNRFAPSMIFGGLLSLLSGIPGIGLAVTGLTKGVGFLNDKLQDLRGYNPDGTPMTQDDYEKARRDRQIQGRIDNIMEKQRLGKTFSQTNLDSLMDMTDRFGDKFSPSTAQNVLTGRDLKGFTESRMGITSPNVIERFTTPIGPQSVNVPTGVQTIDVELPGTDLMAFAPNSKLDRALKNLYSGYENLGIQSPQMIELMQQDLLENKEKGTPLSLPANAYTLVG